MWHGGYGLLLVQAFAPLAGAIVVNALAAADSACTGGPDLLEADAVRRLLVQYGLPAQPGTSPCDNLYTGVVKCEATGDDPCILSVTELIIGGNNPAPGPLPAVISQLTELRLLHLPGNSITGSLERLADLTKMVDLDLTGNKFTGTLEPLRSMPYMQKLKAADSGVHGRLDPLSGMTKLTSLCLDNTKVAGTLDPLGSLVDLEELLLSDVKISGNLQPLANMREMQILSMAKNDVEGGLDPLRQMTKLKGLDLHKTNIFGDLLPLEKMTQLTTLKLSQTNINGDLKPLSGMMEMKSLHLSRTDIHGNLYFLSRMTLIKELSLHDTDVSGTLQPLSRMLDMTRLNLQHTEINGGLDQLNKMRAMVALVLSNTLVNGPLSELGAMIKLQVLDLSSTDVSGDLQFLGNMVRLTELDMHNTRVQGSLEPLAKASKLQVVILSDTDITGDLLPLAGLVRISRLDLHRTGVHGGLEPLASMRDMAQLNLADTGIDGSLEPLRDMKTMQSLSLAHTRVGGKLDPLSTAEGLLQLDVSHTRLNSSLEILSKLPLIQIDVSHSDVHLSGLTRVSSLLHVETHFFRFLVRLFASHCKGFAGDVKDLLYRFGGCQSLSILQLENTSLYGIVPSLENVRKVKLSNVLFDRVDLHLASALHVLDLSRNNIRGVRKVSSGILSRLVLAGNPIKDVDWEVFQGLGTFIDLRDTNLSAEEWFDDRKLTADTKVAHVDNRSGFQCNSISGRPLLMVSPEKFAPKSLCACLPGFQGHGISCSPCYSGYFKIKAGPQECERCGFAKTPVAGVASACEFDLSIGIGFFILFVIALVACNFGPLAISHREHALMLIDTWRRRLYRLRRKLNRRYQPRYEHLLLGLSLPAIKDLLLCPTFDLRRLRECDEWSANLAWIESERWFKSDRMHGYEACLAAARHSRLANQITLSIAELEFTTGQAGAGWADIFLCHAQIDTTEDIVLALCNYEAAHGAGFRYFIDIWCIRHNVKGDFEVALVENVTFAIGRTLVVVHSWQEPHALSRMWCLFEIYTSAVVGSKVEVTFVQNSTLDTDEYEESLACILRACTSTDVCQALCLEEKDRQCMLKMLKDGPGVLQSNVTVISALMLAMERAMAYKAAVEKVRTDRERMEKVQRQLELAGVDHAASRA